MSPPIVLPDVFSSQDNFVEMTSLLIDIFSTVTRLAFTSEKETLMEGKFT
jgi:hypothetical protein